MRYLSMILLLLAPAAAPAIELDGQIEFGRRLELNSSISARIESILVSAGERVSAGQLVVKLVETGLRANAASERAEADALAPAAERMRSELEKARELFARDSLAVVELQRAEQDYAIALSKLEAAEAKLARALHLLSQADIRSPIDGLVIEVNAFAGQYVNTRVENQRLMTIVDPDTMIAEAAIPWELANRLLLQSPAEVRYGDQLYRGKVVEIGRRVIVGSNNHPAVRLAVEFQAGGVLAAGLPVRISIAVE